MKYAVRKRVRGVLALLMVFCLLLGSTGCGAPASKSAQNQIKNVILMIADGASASVPTLSRWYRAYDEGSGTVDPGVTLAADPYLSGAIRTYWVDSDGTPGAITDSAAAATAYATGCKTCTGYLGVDAGGQPRATVLELAQSLGRSCGLVATVPVEHATPAAFAAHAAGRSDYEGIAAQMAAAGLDVVLGGGAAYLAPNNRTDGRDLRAELEDSGCGYVTSAQELAAYDGSRVWGLFADLYMHNELDRAALAPTEPSLLEMTQAAIRLLSKNDNGFFLMVEGSKVDWAAHNNDPAAIVSEYLAFDDAVDCALRFAKGRDDTMVLILTDHGTGGLSIGSARTDSSYAGTKVSQILAPLHQAQLTADGALELLSQGRDVREVLALYGISNPTEAELKTAAALTTEGATGENHAALGAMLSRRCKIGWTTTGHDGEDVPFYSYLPGGASLTGVRENTDIAKLIETALGGSLDELTARRFG